MVEDPVNKEKNGNKVLVTFLSTGTVSLRPSLQTQPSSRSTIFRRALMMTDRNWTLPVPVGVFLIHHQDGPILFDTGEDPACNSDGYFPNFTFKMLTKMHIEPEDGIVDQLEKIGCDPCELQAIIMSHLHHDHAGGLRALSKRAPNVPIYVGQDHWAAYGKSAIATYEGCIPDSWPKNFKPRLMSPSAPGVGPWAEAYAVTSDRSVLAVSTPGHVVGHMSLVIQGHHVDGTKTTYFLPGDAAYSIAAIDNSLIDGSTWDASAALASLQKIKQLACEKDIVVLPSHDTKTPDMLSTRRIYHPKLQSPL